MSKSPPTDDFRWRAFFQRASEPLFVLNRQNVLLFVNRAWEKLTGISAEAAKGMRCRRPKSPGAAASWVNILKHMMTPSEEARAGQWSRCRRLIPARRGEPPWWWTVEMTPLSDENGVFALLGKIIPSQKGLPTPGFPVPEALAILREKHLSRYSLDQIVRRLPIMERLANQVRVAARCHEPVLLVGPPGSGMTTLARTIHYSGEQRQQALAVLDCGRLPDSAVGRLLLEDSPQGVGAVYLKHPHRLAPELQELLAHRLGEEGGPRFLAGLGEPERLLPDFYHAISTLRIEVPSLRERRDDLPHLVDQILYRLNSEKGQRASGLSADVWELFLSHTWPGNLSELSSNLRTAWERCEGESIGVEDLPRPFLRSVQGESEPEPVRTRPLELKTILDDIERRMIERALERYDGNRTKAAESLSVWRAYLIRRIGKLGIDTDEAPEDSDS